jgi:hypothetical protein
MIVDNYTTHNILALSVGSTDIPASVFTSLPLAARGST